jgi:pyridoxal phosphate-dependent aminotransferase EpsN
VFLDSERASWNLDPNVLEHALTVRARAGRLPKALVVVHLFGQSADLDPIVALCERHGVLLLEDAAEALGTLYRGRPAGTIAPVGAFSFNGNKIITTTGGGMLVAHDADRVRKARFWSTQARDPGWPTTTADMGYNYRMSNLLAGIGEAARGARRSGGGGGGHRVPLSRCLRRSAGSRAHAPGGLWAAHQLAELLP